MSKLARAKCRIGWYGAVLTVAAAGIIAPHRAPADSRIPDHGRFGRNNAGVTVSQFHLAQAPRDLAPASFKSLVPHTTFPGLLRYKLVSGGTTTKTPLAGLLSLGRVQAGSPKPKPYFGLSWDPTEPIRTPDCSIAKSPTHILQAVNSRITVLDELGRIVLDNGTGANFRRLGELLSGIEGTEDVEWFGPRCLYDAASGRFILAVAGADFAAEDEAWIAIAVSAGSNPLEGEWTVHGYRTDVAMGGPVSRWPDALDLGADGSFLILTWNDHQFGTNTFVHARLWSFNRSGLLDGTETTFAEIPELRDSANALAFSVKPCRHYGANDAFYLASSKPLGAATLELWKLTGTPQAPVLTSVSVPDVTNYQVPPNARQPGVSQRSAWDALETGDCRIQCAVADNNRIWTSLNSSLDGVVPDAAIHIAEVDGQTGLAVQSRGIGARGTDYYFAALDTTEGRKPGTVIVFCSSSKSQGAGLRYCTRLHSMPPGQFRTSKPLIVGNGKYDPAAPRDPGDPQPLPLWGRYTGAVRDPAKPEQVLLAGPFSNTQKARSPKAWATRLKLVTPK